MNSDLTEKLDYARRVLAERLSGTYKHWQVEGETVKGPDALEVIVEDHHQCGETHLDIGFVVNRERADIPVLWDCVAGSGATTNAGLSRAVETWVTTTSPVFLEFLTRDGSFAEHFHGDDAQGCPGWHVIHGPWIAFGANEAPDVLQAWALDNPLLPMVGPIAARSFSRTNLNCVKMLFGFGDSDISEVRVNGDFDEAASEYLRSLPWPRSRDVAFARCFFLFVHPE